MIVWPLAVLFLTAQAQPAATGPREGTGLIVGRVVDAAIGQPVSGVTVTLAASLPTRIADMPIDPAGLRALTGTDGYFVFRALPAGSYSISATKPAWIHGGYGRRRPDGLSQSLTLTDGQRIGDIAGALCRHSARLLARHRSASRRQLADRQSLGDDGTEQ